MEYIVGSPYVDELASGGWTLDVDGMLEITELPGLGIQLDREALKKYTGSTRVADFIA